MSKDHTKGAWNRIGHGFKAFGSGFIDSLETGGVKEGTSIALVHHGELIIPEEHVNEVITQSKKATVLSPACLCCVPMPCCASLPRAGGHTGQQGGRHGSSSSRRGAGRIPHRQGRAGGQVQGVAQQQAGSRAGRKRKAKRVSKAEALKEVEVE